MGLPYAARTTYCNVAVTDALLGGAGIDALPVSETMLEWCTLVAR